MRCRARAGWKRSGGASQTATVGGVGGRFVDHVDGRERTGRTRRVGRITWYGRVIGRHDRDTEYHGDVEVLPGANMAFRRPLVHMDGRLLHTANGLALANELDACLTVRRLGHRLVFTPEAVVDHYTTSYRDPRLGSRVAGDDIGTSAANYTYTLLKYLPAPRRPAFLLYAFLLGSSMLPGPGRALAELAASPRRAWAMAQRIGPTWRGRATGISMYRAWRREGRPFTAPSQVDELGMAVLPVSVVIPTIGRPRSWSGASSPCPGASRRRPRCWWSIRATTRRRTRPWGGLRGSGRGPSRATGAESRLP